MKSQVLRALREEWIDCKRCKLRKTRTNVVFGEGNPDADLMIIGEGPGATEDVLGKPFQGNAGTVLDEFLASGFLNRDRDCYVTNVVACRPTARNIDERTGKETVENRVPTKEEREECWPRLWQQIYTVDPLLIVTIGKTPLQVLTGKSAKIGRLRGQVQTMVMDGKHVQIRYPVFPVYHTAYLLRNHDPRPEGPWGQSANDFVEICRIIDHLREVYYGTKKPERWKE